MGSADDDDDGGPKDPKSPTVEEPARKTHHLDQDLSEEGAPISCPWKNHSICCIKEWNNYGRYHFFDGTPWRATECMICHRRFAAKKYKPRYSDAEKKKMFFADDSTNYVYACKGAMETEFADIECKHAMCAICFVKQRDAASPRNKSKMVVRAKNNGGGGKVLATSRRAARCNLGQAFDSMA